MKDFLTKREINIKEKVLVVNDRVYASESYIAMDTSKLEGFPPRVYYDKNHNLLGRMYQKGVFELDDIEEILLSYEDTCFSNHDLDDLRELLIKRREDFYKGLEKNSI